MNNSNEIKLTDEQLAAAITDWFKNNQNDLSNIWNRTKTGRAIKNCVVLKGNFKFKQAGKKGAVTFSENVTPTPKNSPNEENKKVREPVKNAPINAAGKTGMMGIRA